MNRIEGGGSSRLTLVNCPVLLIGQAACSCGKSYRFAGDAPGEAWEIFDVTRRLGRSQWALLLVENRWTFNRRPT